jgi:DNA-binding transcriptional LysR family regulator
MSIQTLRCFLVVAEEGSISRAAERLHMSQPPLSVRLKALEGELGVELLARHGRGVEPTAAGRVLVERARRLLVDVDGTADAVRSVGRGVRGRLSLAVGSTVAPSLLAELLGQMRAEAPDVEVVESDMAGDAVHDRVGHGEADAGLLHVGPRDLTEPETLARPGAGERALEIAVVTREPLVVVVPRTDDEAEKERANLAALTDRVLIAPARTSVPGLYEHATAAWRAVDGDPKRVRESGTTTTILALVEAGFGVAVMPAALADVAWSSLAVVPLRQHRPAVETAVVWRHANTSPVLRRFLRLALATPEPDVLGPDRARPRRHSLGSRWEDQIS